MLSRSFMSDSLRLHGLQHARLLCPWDFPGKNTAMGCHCLLQGSLTSSHPRWKQGLVCEPCPQGCFVCRNSQLQPHSGPQEGPPTRRRGGSTSDSRGRQAAHPRDPAWTSPPISRTPSPVSVLRACFHSEKLKCNGIFKLSTIQF